MRGTGAASEMHGDGARPRFHRERPVGGDVREEPGPSAGNGAAGDVREAGPWPRERGFPGIPGQSLKPAGGSADG